MKIAMLMSNPFPPEEGIGFYVYNLSKKLIAMGHEVTIITRGSFNTKIEFYEDIKVYKVRFIPLYPFHVNIHGFFVNKLFKSLEKEFDIIHIHTPLTPILNTSLPLIATIHGSMIGNAKDIKIVDLKSLGTKILTKFVSYPLVSKLIDNSNVITTVSNSVKLELQKYYSVDNILIIENGVDDKKFFPSNNKSNYILYVGRLSYAKGLFELLNSAKQICNKYDVKFYIVGKGELEKKLKEKLITEGLEKNVKLLGSLNHDKLINIYQKASIFLFLSKYEGFPTVVLEAMSSGLPVLVSDIDAHKNFIENCKNGILIKKGSTNDAVKKISLLLDDENLRNTLGKNARKTVEEKFTWDIISHKFEKVYRNMIH
jgi:glycosyltransferase involved in cell wall biosynthesis